MASVTVVKQGFAPEFMGILHDVILPAAFGGGAADYAVRESAEGLVVATERTTVNGLQGAMDNFLSLLADPADAVIVAGDAESVVSISCPAGGLPELMVEVWYLNQVWMVAQAVAAVDGAVTVELAGDDVDGDGGYYVVWLYDGTNKARCGMVRVRTAGYEA